MFEHGNGRGWVTGLAIASLGLSGVGYVCSKRVSERDAAYKTVRGELVATNLEPGLYPSNMLPHVKVTTLPKFLQSVTVHAGEDSPINVRTKERARVYGDYDVMFELDDSDKNFGNIYTELKADEINDIKPFIEKFAVPAIIKIYKDVTSSSDKTKDKDQVVETESHLTKSSGVISMDDHLSTGEAIAEELQKILDEQGYTYIRIKRVIPSGVGLSPEANAQLEQIVAEERKLELLKVQEQVADAAVSVTKKQSAVTTEAIKGLKDAGIPESELVQAYYLQLMRDLGKVGTPFVPGPIPGTGVGAVPTSK